VSETKSNLLRRFEGTWLRANTTFGLACFPKGIICVRLECAYPAGRLLLGSAEAAMSDMFAVQSESGRYRRHWSDDRLTYALCGLFSLGTAAAFVVLWSWM